MPKLLSIQYLRTIAALSVVTFHASGRVGAPFELGAAGVDIFFVISGCIMWIVSRANTNSPTEFLVNRLCRIVPLYWIATLGWACLAALAPRQLPGVKPSVGHVLLSLLFIPHHNWYGRIEPLLLVGWSLDCEMFFYVLFTFGLCLHEKRRLAFLSIAMIALVLVGQTLNPGNPVAVAWTRPLSLEFLAGTWLGWIWETRRLPDGLSGALMVAVGAGVFALEGVWGVADQAWRVVIWGVPSFLLVAGLLSMETDGWVPRVSPLEALGDASYSIYLLHSMFIGALFYATRSLPKEITVAACLFVAATVGTLSYRLVEQPLNRLLRGFRRRLRRHGASGIDSLNAVPRLTHERSPVKNAEAAGLSGLTGSAE